MASVEARPDIHRPQTA